MNIIHYFIALPFANCLKYKIKNFAPILIIAFIAPMLVACGAGGKGGNNSGGDNTPPTVTATPEGSTVISPFEPIQFVFSEPMDQATLAFGGTAGDSMSALSDGGVWADEVTLVVSPAPAWQGGIGQTMVIDANDVAGNAMATFTLTLEVDDVAPAGTPDINATIINNGASIQVVFNESMSPLDLALGGSMAQESDGGVWSQTALPNDTLTISPATTWSQNYGANLVVGGSDLVGNPMAPLDLGYTVIGVSGGIYLVKQTGSDANDGKTPATAFATISKGLNAASLAGETDAAVLVAGGTYKPGSSLRMSIDGISLFGGFTGNFRSRFSTLSTIDSTGLGATPTLSINPGLTAKTILDGFRMIAGNGSNPVGISVSGSVIIRNNVVISGVGTASSYGIMVANGASPIIVNNTIDGGGGAQTFGIVSSSSSPYIANNIIYNRPPAPAVTRLIDACIYEPNAVSTPTGVENNNLFCNWAYWDSNGAGQVTTEAGVNGLADTVAGGNIIVDPVFFDPTTNDLQLSPASPVSVTQGGLNFGDDPTFGFLLDIAGTPRPGAGLPWSMGAYQAQ